MLLLIVFNTFAHWVHQGSSRVGGVELEEPIIRGGCGSHSRGLLMKSVKGWTHRIQTGHVCLRVLLQSVASLLGDGSGLWLKHLVLNVAV